MGDARLAASVGAALALISWQALITGTFATFALAAVYGGTLLALHRQPAPVTGAIHPYRTLAAIAL